MSNYQSAKRIFDLFLAAAILPLAIVLCIVFGVAFSVSNRVRPVYRQERTGLDSGKFLVWKLRTMTEEKDAAGVLLPDEMRLTPLGRFMRATSIDELPQIINILKGEMSFVGPRPQVAEFLTAMTDEERRRHDVLPGLTGWAQINGRNAVSWSERFAQDLWYIDNASFWLDVGIMLRTPLAVLSANNTKHAGHATMPSLFDERRTGEAD